MNSSEFGKLGAAKAATLSNYINVASSVVVSRETLRFVDDNFRMQGWQGASFQPWAPIKRKGTILVLTGKLRRGFNSANQGNGVTRFWNNMQYGVVHNQGFQGTVNVSAHKRSTYIKAKASSRSQLNSKGQPKIKAILNKTGEHNVNGYTRHMNVIQRQFAPYEGSESPVLNDAIIKAITKDIQNILTF